MTFNLEILKNDSNSETMSYDTLIELKIAVLELLDEIEMTRYTLETERLINSILDNRE
jgi:hypothetical protein